jgi:hypothetical protein
VATWPYLSTRNNKEDAEREKKRPDTCNNMLPQLWIDDEAVGPQIDGPKANDSEKQID